MSKAKMIYAEVLPLPSSTGPAAIMTWAADDGSQEAIPT